MKLQGDNVQLTTCITFQAFSWNSKFTV